MKSLLVSLLSFCSLVTAAQPLNRVFAFSRVFTPGMVRQREIPVENTTGTAPADRLENIQYYIYARLTMMDGIRFHKIWIKGQWLDIKKTGMVSAPVTDPEQPGRIIISGSQSLIRIEPGAAWTRGGGSFPTLRTMQANSDFIICYSWLGKYYYKNIQTITVLEPVMGQ